MSKYRNYHFVLNNYQSKPDIVEKIKELPYKYLIWGEEEGKEGTPHKQGTIIFKSPKTETAARESLKGCHVEVVKDLHGSIEYCKKDGEYEEYGTPPKTSKEKGKLGGEAEQQRWRDIREAAEEGREEDIPDSVRWKDYKAVEHFKSVGLKRRDLPDTEEQHLWYWGESRTGKSRKAREDHPVLYDKNPNKWWDGYEDEEVVLIEDFDKRHDKVIYYLKRWADRYPFNAEIKGSARKIRPKLIIVTSNYHPKDIWTDEQDLEPIKERFKIIEFKKLGPQKKKMKIANLEEQMKSY